MIRLGVNVDHVATLRQARRAKYPDPVSAVSAAELAGANNITCHLREDRRHIQDRDVRLIRDLVQSELNLEMAATQEMVRFALELKPDTVTLVPEKRQEITTEGGLDLTQQKDSFTKAIALLREAGINVSLFVDPDLEAIKLAHRNGAQAVEIHTGRYADAIRPSDRQRELARLIEAVQFASKLRLGVHAGHGLNYHNVEEIAAIRPIESLQIGHAIVAQSIFVGFEEAVRQMKSLMTQARNALGD